MPNNRQLLKQVRKVAAAVNRGTHNPEHKYLLTAADVLFNELLLQDEPDFYLDHLNKGRKLLAEGRQLSRGRAAAAHDVALRGDLNAETRVDILNDEIIRLYGLLVHVVEGLDESRSSAERDYLVRLCDWENDLYNHRLEPAANADIAEDPLTAESLQIYLRRKFPQWRNLRVLSFTPLSGGFSKKTIFFETEDEVNGRQAMVMRAEQTTNFLGYEGSDVRQEFHSIQLMRRAGLPIAEPLWLEADAGQLGTRFLVSRRAAGGTRGGNMGADGPVGDKLLRSIMATFIKMHNIRLDPDDPLVQKSHFREWMPYKTVSEATRFCVTDFVRRLIRINDIPMTPQLLRALQWLERNVPQVDEPPVVVHIDFAFNNLIIDEDEITAVLDWESSRLGDPAEDIIWTQLSLAPYMSMTEFLRQYRDGTDREISEYRIAYNRVLKCLLNAITCLSALRVLEKDDTAHVILGTLGLKYMAIFGTQFNAFIDEAERTRETEAR